MRPLSPHSYLSVFPHTHNAIILWRSPSYPSAGRFKETCCQQLEFAQCLYSSRYPNNSGVFGSWLVLIRRTASFRPWCQGCLWQRRASIQNVTLVSVSSAELDRSIDCQHCRSMWRKTISQQCHCWTLYQWQSICQGAHFQVSHVTVKQSMSLSEWMLEVLNK